MRKKLSRIFTTEYTEFHGERKILNQNLRATTVANTPWLIKKEFD